MACWAERAPAFGLSKGSRCLRAEVCAANGTSFNFHLDANRGRLPLDELGVGGGRGRSLTSRQSAQSGERSDGCVREPRGTGRFIASRNNAPVVLKRTLANLRRSPRRSDLLPKPSWTRWGAPPAQANTRYWRSAKVSHRREKTLLDSSSIGRQCQRQGSAYEKGRYSGTEPGRPRYPKPCARSRVSPCGRIGRNGLSPQRLDIARMNPLLQFSLRNETVGSIGRTLASYR